MLVGVVCQKGVFPLLACTLECVDRNEDGQCIRTLTVQEIAFELRNEAFYWFNDSENEWRVRRGNESQ